MGGRGGDSGLSLPEGSGANVNVISTEDVWSYRHNPDNEDFVDAINTGAARIQDDFRDLMNTVSVVAAAELGGLDRTQTLGFYDPDDKTVALNINYTNIDKMNKTYDDGVSSGYHPGRGDRSGTEAVALHELGHALTDHIATKMGLNFDKAAKQIVDSAYKASRGRGGTLAWAGTISGYAQHDNAECIAEAVADYYCNGNSAAKASIAIMNELRKYNR